MSKLEKCISIFLCFIFIPAKSFCQFDTSAFRNIPGDLYCCSDDSSELLKDTLVFPKYAPQKSSFLLAWEKRCDAIDPPPYIFFQPRNDSIIFVYGFSNGKNKNQGIIVSDDDDDVEQKISVLRGRWKFGKSKNIIIADFPAWKMNVTWQVEERKDCWLFIRKKK